MRNEPCQFPNINQILPQPKPVSIGDPHSKVSRAFMEDSYNSYVLGRNPQASNRLNQAHHYWKEQNGFLLHPDVPVAQEDLKIADVGAGTGIWLVELSKTLPISTQLDGFDIDLSQAPPKQWLPSNVAIHRLDAFSTLPQHLLGRYDVVHLRLFLVLIKRNDPVPLLRNLISMLKPGGFVQWDEHDHVSQKVVTADQTIDPETIHAVLDFVKPFDDIMGPRTWVSALADTFAEQGLLEPRLYRYPLPPELYRYDTDNVLSIYEEISKKVLDGRGKGEGEELRRLIAAAFVDSQRGVAICHDKVIAIGQKPVG